MIWVIGTSTTVEYALKSVYENTIGRATELVRSGPTEEDLFAARFARAYVDFINVEPWYKYDFKRELRDLWRISLWGPNLIRKWERNRAQKRIAIVTPVSGLSAVLRELDAVPDAVIEHVFDY